MQTIINGKAYSQDKALISVKDRGFRLGDSVFETIAIHEGIPYQIELHLKRLKSGISALKIKADLTPLKKQIDRLIKINKLQNGFVRITITRGESGFGYSAKDIGPANIIIETEKKLKTFPTAVTLQISSYKKISNKSLPSNIKHGNGLNSILARLEAEENGCFDAILLSEKGYITETSSGNIFWVKNKKIHTPKNNILEGTIRAAIMRLSTYKIKQGNYKPAELKKADEIFICNVAWGILPVSSVKDFEDKYPIGKITKTLKQLLEQDIRDYGKSYKS